MERYFVNEKCPQKTRICGKDTVNTLCLDENYSCPINDFQVRYVKDTDLVKQGYTEKKVDNDLYFYITNNKTDGQFLVDTEMANEMLCIYYEEEHTDHDEYPLMKGTFKRKCSTIPYSDINIDSRYRKIIPYKKRDLFDENGISYYLFRLSGFYASYLQGDYSFFGRGYIHWSDQCKFAGHNSKKETIELIHSKIGSIRSYFWLILFFFLILSIINSVAFFFIFKSHILRYLHVIMGKAILFINYIAYLIIMKTQNIQNQMKDFMNNFSLNICSDSITNTILRESFRLFNKVEGLQRSVFFVWKYFIYVVIAFSFLVFIPLIYRMMLIKIKLIAI
jgi:hypothetical protein